jgi:hypothetical protein
MILRCIMDGMDRLIMEASLQDMDLLVRVVGSRLENIELVLYVIVP